ncbi:penicillin acylase family protein [Hymenobacter weizhouensis]|uniref:penicillin acylase family protein n=1 Tax=Hymenobacter sp. YIM 151500-1 TaxID=2987689 RepID=UPI002226C896|nr:penicillin acylase family protein [Hymenobacter sp. YIM 151500-1]UYZ61994.1 penicillin acylase family protein [Hymenobacter sp. YIM 151500-1]
MLRFLKPALALLVSLTLTWVLNTKQGDVPPVGRLLSPYRGFWQNGETAADFPVRQTLALAELHQPVQVRFDDRRVPHLFAQNEHDLYYAQGYLTARDRLWQMEFMTRVAAGRISEVVGPRALEYDRFQRRMGLPYGAGKSLQAMLQNDTTRQVLEAYSAGVNAYISQLRPQDYPFEYKLLDYAPEPWQPLKCALLLKLMAWDLSGRSDDLRLSNILRKYGPAVVRDLFPGYPTREDPIVPVGTPRDFTPLPVPPVPPSFQAAVSGRVPAWEPDAELGSNNFAVAGSRSASGLPLLANDPHLQLNLPSIWYQVQLHAPGLNVYGVTIPGAPAVIIGFNEHVAWGVTNVGGDVLDWYQLKFRDSTRRAYWHDGRWKPVRRVVERVQVRGQADRIDTVLYTHHGPVVYDQAEEPFNPQTPVRHALRWTAHDPANEVLAFLRLNRARTYQDYDRALRTYGSPAQNFIFASRQNDIAIRPNGRFPLKWPEQGKFILDGTDPRHDWQGWIPMSQTPRVQNPARGFVSSANQHSAGPDYPYYLGWDYAPWDRGHRINEQLAKMRRATPDSLRRLQNDNLGVNARLMLPWMLATLEGNKMTDNCYGLLAPNSPESAAAQELAKWDYHYTTDAVAATIFELWYQELVKRLWDDDFGKKATGLEMRHPSRDRTNRLLLSESGSTLNCFQGASPWIDDRRTPEKENVHDLLTASLHFAVDSLTRKFGPLGPKWRWANQKSTDINHLAQLPGFGHQDIDCAGSPGTVNATGPRNGPSWRMVVALGPQVRAYGIFPGGQSGNPASPHYDDMLETWRTGRLDELVFLRAADENHPRVRAAWRLE